jgi:hypothetical protein
MEVVLRLLPFDKLKAVSGVERCLSAASLAVPSTEFLCARFRSIAGGKSKIKHLLPRLAAVAEGSPVTD